MLSIVDWGKGLKDSAVIQEQSKLLVLARELIHEAARKEKNAEFLRLLGGRCQISVEIYASSDGWKPTFGQYQYWQGGIVLDEYSLVGINLHANNNRPLEGLQKLEEGIIPLPVLLEILGLGNDVGLLIEWLHARTRWGQGFQWTTVSHRRCYTGFQVVPDEGEEDGVYAFHCESCNRHFSSEDHPEIDLDLQSIDLPVVYANEVVWVHPDIS